MSPARCLALLLLLLPSTASAEQTRSPWYWDEEKARLFAAGRVGAGATITGELDIGYGKPFWLWAGFQGWGAATTESAMASAGFKLALPIVELTGGYRFNYAYARSPLAERGAYTSAELDAHDASHRYDALDMDLIGFVPLPHLVVVPQLGFHRVLEQQAPLYEEEQRVIMAPPWLLYAKLGALVTWGPARRYGLGALFEHFAVGRRQTISRLGPWFVARFTPHLMLQVLATLPVRGPDELSFYDGMGGTATLRYSWASGESAPEFP